MDLFIVIGIVAIALIIYRLRKKENFSAEKRADQIIGTKEIFSRKLPFSDYKKAVPGTDAVEHSAMQQLYDSGKFTREEIKKELLEIDPHAQRSS